MLHKPEDIVVALIFFLTPPLAIALINAELMSRGIEPVDVWRAPEWYFVYGLCIFAGTTALLQNVLY